jgi:hypothetical protein
MLIFFQFFYCVFWQCYSILQAAAKASTQVQKSAAAADDEDMDPTV